MYNISKTIDWLHRHSGIKSKGQCATYVRQALEAGGCNLVGHPVAAQDYDRFLLKKGWEEYHGPVIPGLVAVMHHGKYGHICVWCGDAWYSDFKQRKAWPYSGEGKVKYFMTS